jgi:hypothetical protein
MKILFDGKIRTNASAVTMTNPDDNYPASNLLDIVLAVRAQAVGANTVITITLDDDYDVSSFFYALHNLNTFSVEFKNSVGGSLGTVNVTNITSTGAEYFTTKSAVRSVELTLAAAAGNVYLGGFEVGEPLRIRNMFNEWPLGLNDRSRFRKSDGGYVTCDNITPLKIREFEFRELLKAEVEEELEQYIISGKKPVFIDPTEDNHDYMLPMYCTIQEPPNSMKSGRRFSNRLIIEEAR